MTESKTIVMSIKDVISKFNILGLIYLIYLIIILLLNYFTKDIALFLVKYIDIQYELLMSILLLIGVLVSGILLFSYFRIHSKITNKEIIRKTNIKLPYIELSILALSSCLLGTFLTSLISTFLPLGITLMNPIGINILDYNNLNIIMIILLIIVCPIVEEYIFRGITLRFLGRFSNRFGVICTSIIFSLFHLQVVQIIPSFIFSYILCLVTLRYKSIIPSIIVHSITNLSLLFLVSSFNTNNYIYLIIIIIILYLASIYIVAKFYNNRVIIPYEPDSNMLIKLLLKRFSFIIIFIIIFVFNILILNN